MNSSMYRCSCLVFSQDYKSLFEGAGTNPGEKTLEDKFFEHEVYEQSLLNSSQIYLSTYTYKHVSNIKYFFWFL